MVDKYVWRDGFMVNWKMVEIEMRKSRIKTENQFPMLVIW